MLSLSLKNIRCFSLSSTSKAAASMIEKNLFSLPISVKNCIGETISLNAVYQDSIPEGSSQGTCIGLHGCPGSHIDFKYIEPLLTKAGIRFIGINYPGLGFTSYDERLKNDNFERHQFVQQVIDGLNLKENLVFMGHSRGTENALMAAASNHEKTKGLILLNPIGISVHRGIRPRWRVQFLATLWASQWFRFFTNWLLHHIYNYLKLKVQNEKEAGVCITTMSSVLLEKQLPYIETVNKSSMKVFIGSAGKDWLIEPWISKEFMALFHQLKLFETSTIGDEPEMIAKVLKEFEQGTKSIGVFFPNENHFLQKFRAILVKEIIVKCIYSKD